MASSRQAPVPSRLGPRLGAIALLAIGGLALLLPPDGQSRSHLAQFAGRFHPVLVHLPIALVLLVPILELAGSLRPAASLRSAAPLILALAAASAAVAAFDGWLLARHGAYRGALVIQHLWTGEALAVLCLVLVWIRPAPTAPSLPRSRAYALLLAAAVGLVIWASVQGSALTRGGDYLTEYMPAGLRRWLRMPAAEPRPAPPPPKASLFGQKVAPIFADNCVSCHGPKKVKGHLRLDSYDGLRRGGEDGPVVDPGHPERSEMIRRLTLPPDDDDFMPGSGKKPLAPEQIKVIADWISAGASEKP